MNTPEPDLAALRQASLQHRLILDAGPFRVRCRSGERDFLATLASFYGPGMHTSVESVVDFEIAVNRPRTLRRWVRPQAIFTIDGLRPFDPQPVSHAFPMYEWGLNWCIATSAHRYLMLHAGTVAFAEHALILPGNPGSGKSTLCAALTLRGGRLLSDEFGLVRPERLDVMPMPRGIPLKNASIPAILEFDPGAELGPIYLNTRKGTVRHLKPGETSLAAQAIPARPRWLVFPQYRVGATERLAPLEPAEAFRRLALNCFNYKLLGETAFRTIADMVRQSASYAFTFSNLERASEQLLALARS